MIIVLITNKKSPSVIIVTGNEINCKIGFNIAFNIPKTIATKMDAPKLFTDTPGNNHAVKYTATLDINICNNKFILQFINKFVL